MSLQLTVLGGGNASFHARMQESTLPELKLPEFRITVQRYKRVELTMVPPRGYVWFLTKMLSVMLFAWATAPPLALAYILSVPAPLLTNVQRSMVPAELMAPPSAPA